MRVLRALRLTGCASSESRETCSRAARERRATRPTGETLAGAFGAYMEGIGCRGQASLAALHVWFLQVLWARGGNREWLCSCVRFLILMVIRRSQHFVVVVVERPGTNVVVVVVDFGSVQMNNCCSNEHGQRRPFACKRWSSGAAACALGAATSLRIRHQYALAGGWSGMPRPETLSIEAFLILLRERW